MKPAQRLILWLGLVLIVVLIGFLLPKSPKRVTTESSESGATPSRQGPQINQPVGTNQQQDPGLRDDADSAEVGRLLVRCFEKFSNSSEIAESVTILNELRDGIRAANPAYAASAIQEFLKSGRDTPTRLPFVVGSGGVMETTPTFRTALLDLAPSLDPTLALEISREIMDSKKSPDEFALALRNLAWNDLDGDSIHELSERFKQMIETEEWSADPSVGFLEAMDAAVEISDGNAFAALLGLGARANSEGNVVFARATFVALDRMVIREPALLVNAFALDPGMSGITADQRASLMSRLDLVDPAQRDLFARYLAETAHGEGELDYFAELFPNGNYLHGNWLFTSLDPALSRQARLESDRKVLAELDRMIADGKQPIQTIVKIRERLQKVTLTPPQE